MSIAMAEEVVSEVTGQVAEVAEKAAEGRMTLDIGNNLLYAILCDRDARYFKLGNFKE